jgi:hypothetical protein
MKFLVSVVLCLCACVCWAEPDLPAGYAYLGLITENAPNFSVGDQSAIKIKIVQAVDGAVKPVGTEFYVLPLQSFSIVMVDNKPTVAKLDATVGQYVAFTGAKQCAKDGARVVAVNGVQTSSSAERIGYRLENPLLVQ